MRSSLHVSRFLRAGAVYRYAFAGTGACLLGYYAEELNAGPEKSFLAVEHLWILRVICITAASRCTTQFIHYSARSMHTWTKFASAMIGFRTDPHYPNVNAYYNRCAPLYTLSHFPRFQW